MSLHIRHSPRREWRRITKISKARTSETGEDALRRLRSFLDTEEPQVVQILARLWEDQRQAITYQELRTAILNGVIDEQTAQDWMNDYAHFFNEKLRPRMEDAMRTANAKLEADHPGLFFNTHDPGVQNWLSTRGGELITVIGGEQRRAINAMIGRAYTGEWSVDELSRVIRPAIGLNRPQAIANLNYYETVRSGLLENNPTMRQSTAAKRAREAAVKYAERQHRYRAFMIARTEMAFAYNRGMDEGIKQAIAKGYMGPCVRVWATAADERMCPVCGELEGVEIGMEGEYDFSRVNSRLPSGPTPPAHPNCRCAVDYREIAPPYYGDGSLAELRNSELTIPDDDGIMPTMEDMTLLTEQTRNPMPHLEFYGPSAVDVDLDYIRSNEYRMKFHGITGNHVVDDKIAEQCKQILESRTGTRRETLVLLDSQTGNLIATISDTTKDNAISYTHEAETAIRKALSVGKRIISIHNHPEGYPPTADDCGSARYRGYSLGIVCGHNGAIYTYEPSIENLTESYCNSIHDKIFDSCRFYYGTEQVDVWIQTMTAYGFVVRKVG